MKLIKATKQKGAKRLHRLYLLENQEDFAPSFEITSGGNNLIEFPADFEDKFLEEIEAFREEQIKRLSAEARRSNVFEVEDVAVEQGSKEWFEQRAGIITASDTPFRVDGTKIPTWDNYINEKVAQPLRIVLGIKEKEGFRSAIMENGNLLEDSVREEYERLTGNKIVQKGFVKAKSLMFGASPDGITTDEDFNTINIEIKNVTLPRYIAELHNKAVSNEYRAQVQVQMTILNIDKTHFLVSCQETDRLPMLINEIERDEIFISNMIETIKEFERDFQERYALISKKIKEKQ
jgi:predicted phage-related endonuclease